MVDWQVVGQQRFVIQEDLISWEAQGDLTPLEITQIFGRGVGVQAEHRYAMFLITIVGPWSFPPAARRALAEFHQQNHAVGVTAVVGASTTMRLLIDLVLRAIARVSGTRPNTRFFRTHGEAQVWLAEQRTLGRQGQLGK